MWHSALHENKKKKDITDEMTSVFWIDWTLQPSVIKEPRNAQKGKGLFEEADLLKYIELTSRRSAKTSTSQNNFTILPERLQQKYRDENLCLKLICFTQIFVLLQRIIGCNATMS